MDGRSVEQAFTQGYEWAKASKLTAYNRAAIPGPASTPLVDWRIRLLPVLRDPVMGMLRFRKLYGDIVAVDPSDAAPILVFAPEYNRLLMTDTSLFHSLDTSSGDSLLKMPRDTAASRLLSGVASMNGEMHTRHRRMLMPAFHRKHLDSLRDSIVERIEMHIARWRDGQRLNLLDENVELSLAMAITGLLGLEPEEEGARIHDVLQAWSSDAMSIAVNLMPFNIPGLPFRRFMALSERLEEELKGVIQRKLARMSAGDENSGDALSILVHTREGEEEDPQNAGEPPAQQIQLTEAQLLGHLATLFSSGHETTASALTWTLFLLAQHPQAAADLVDELSAKLHGTAPSLEQLGELPLLDRVINEGLRMFPPGTWMLRTSTGPFELGPYSLPARTHLVLSPAVVHRREEIYTEPDRFLPGRWESIDPSPYEYMPFGAGSRRCLGATFAMLELRLAIAIIMQRFRLEVPDGTTVDRAGVVLSLPRGGLPVAVHKQDRDFRAGRIRGNIYDLLAPATETVH